MKAILDERDNFVPVNLSGLEKVGCEVEHARKPARAIAFFLRARAHSASFTIFVCIHRVRLSSILTTVWLSSGNQ